jgi:hypothetical protein
MITTTPSGKGRKAAWRCAVFLSAYRACDIRLLASVVLQQDIVVYDFACIGRHSCVEGRHHSLEMCHHMQKIVEIARSVSVYSDKTEHHAGATPP